MENNYRIKLRWLIIISTIIRCIFACLIELGNDEVYYFTYAQQMDWNHFDHPPMLGLLIRFFTLNLYWVNDFSMRLGAIILAAFNTWLIAGIARNLMSERAGLIAAILYTSSLFSSIISGLFILPDSIANTFWLAALGNMIQILKADDNQNRSNQLLWLGIWIGLACMSKVHSIFLWFGFIGFIIFFQRELLKNKALYLALLISSICMMPIWIWNEEYQYITWKFHSQRVGIFDSGIRLDFFVQALFGQIFYNNPLLVYLYFVVLILLAKNRFKIYGIPKNIVYLLLFCSLPIILVTTGLSLFRQTLPHWSGPGFFAIMLISAIWIDRRIDLNNIPRIRKILNIQLSFTLIILILAFALIKWYPGNLIGGRNTKELGKGDVTLDMVGWKDLQQQFSKVRELDIKNGEMLAGDAILVNNWFPAGHFYFYLTRPLGIRLISEGKLIDIHKFAWINLTESPILVRENAYFIAPSNTFKDPKELYADLFEDIKLSKILEQKRGNKIVRKWYIYQLKGAKTTIGNKHPLSYSE